MSKPASTTCPYCAAALQKPPQRKTKCPHCGESIFVKRPFGKKEKRLMTAEEAAREETKWSKGYERTKWISHLSAVGVSAHDFDQAQKRLGEAVSAVVVADHLLDQLGSQSSNQQHLKMVHLLKVSTARELGRDPMLHKEAVYRLELEKMRDHARAVIIQTPELDRRTGSQCDKFKGREFSVDEALQEMPLPCGPDCVCGYRPIFKWE